MATRSALKLPDAVQEALQKLIELPEDQYEELKQAVGAAEPSLAAEVVCKSVADGTTVPPETSTQITMALLGIQRAQRRGNVDMVVLLEDVWNAVKDNISLQDGDGSSHQRLTDRLYGLLTGGNAVFVTSKANELMTEHPHVYCPTGTHISTDIRPIFTADMRPSAAVIVHQLEITYHADPDGERRRFFVALDISDIRHLKALLERAEKKEAILGATIVDAKMAYLEANGQ